MLTETKAGLELLEPYRDTTIELLTHWCPAHMVEFEEVTDAKTGKVKWSHRPPEGRLCTQRKESESHWYRVNDEVLPSVTTCLDVINRPALVPWAKKVGRESVREVLLDAPILTAAVSRPSYENWVDAVIEQAKQQPDPGETAAEEGVSAHKWVEEIISGKTWETPDEVPELLRPAVQGALAFIRHYQLELVETEFMSWHPTFKSPGTIDLIAKDPDGRLWVVDWKRSRSLYPEHDYQISAYAANIEALTGETVAEAYVVRLPRDTPEGGEPSYECRAVQDRETAWLAFLAAQELYTLTKGYK